MSSNQPLHITRANYEEYFLLYTDNELSAADRAAVEAFALLHPDLQEELDLLQDTKLDIPGLSFGDTSILTAEHMDRELHNESLLLYIDNELPEAEAKRMETTLRQDAALRAEHALLLQAKLDPADTIVYPYKEELYRNEKKERPALWLRIAAAVILVAGAANFLQDGLPGNDGIARPTAGNPKTTIVIRPDTTAPAVKEDEPAPAMATLAADETPVLAEEVTTATVQKQQAEQTTKKNGNVTIDYAQLQQVVATGVLPKEDATPSVQRTTEIAREGSANTQITSLNINGDVTSVTPVAYINSEAAAAVPGDAPVKQGSVRGMLRKATRFIERRTGFNPADEDGKILIGPGAISLK
jgi:hypothetical protein